jgi:hypothetical protein
MTIFFPNSIAIVRYPAAAIAPPRHSNPVIEKTLGVVKKIAFVLGAAGSKSGFCGGEKGIAIRVCG